MKRIKPCPFCGGAARVLQIPENTAEELHKHPLWKWNNPGLYVIGCDDDPMCYGNINHATMWFPDRESAIEVWNRRAVDA